MLILKKCSWIAGLFFSFLVQAQITGPEQDCINALLIDSLIITQPNSYAGIGNVDDLNGNSACLQNDENNSVWYTFHVFGAGIVEFDLLPNFSGSNGDDYDFSIYDLTGSSCSAIPNGTAQEVRCNYAFSTGPTGLKNGYTSTVAAPGDSSYLAPLSVNAGETYALLVDNFSSTSFGFMLDFTRSTAVLDEPPLPCEVQHITINAGWNLISSYIQPDSTDMLKVVSDIVQDILLIKNGAGQAAIPTLNINTIGNWNIREGYKLKAADSTTLSIGCTQVIPGTTSIPLPAGWSLISYLRDTPMDIDTAINTISTEVLIVKNGVGSSYIPSLGINTIGNMVPGQGYSIKLINPATLVYPGN